MFLSALQCRPESQHRLPSNSSVLPKSPIYFSVSSSCKTFSDQKPANQKTQHHCSEVILVVGFGNLSVVQNRTTMFHLSWTVQDQRAPRPSWSVQNQNAKLCLPWAVQDQVTRLPCQMKWGDSQIPISDWARLCMHACWLSMLGGAHQATSCPPRQRITGSR